MSASYPQKPTLSIPLAAERIAAPARLEQGKIAAGVSGLVEEGYHPICLQLAINPFTAGFISPFAAGYHPNNPDMRRSGMASGRYPRI